MTGCGGNLQWRYNPVWTIREGLPEAVGLNWVRQRRDVSEWVARKRKSFRPVIELWFRARGEDSVFIRVWVRLLEYPCHFGDQMTKVHWVWDKAIIPTSSWSPDILQRWEQHHVNLALDLATGGLSSSGRTWQMPSRIHHFVHGYNPRGLSEIPGGSVGGECCITKWGQEKDLLYKVFVHELPRIKGITHVSRTVINRSRKSSTQVFDNELVRGNILILFISLKWKHFTNTNSCSMHNIKIRDSIHFLLCSKLSQT